MVKLLGHKADLNVGVSPLLAIDYWNDSIDNLKIVELFVNTGVNVNVALDGTSALKRAEDAGNDPAVEALEGGFESRNVIDHDLDEIRKRYGLFLSGQTRQR